MVPRQRQHQVMCGLLEAPPPLTQAHISGAGTARRCPVACEMLCQGGECLPSAHLARYVCINYPDYNPRFTLL